MYWTLVTLTTTGYGDITPQTNLERSFTMCVELLGAVRAAVLSLSTSDPAADSLNSPACGDQRCGCVSSLEGYGSADRIHSSVLWAGLQRPHLQ